MTTFAYPNTDEVFKKHLGQTLTSSPLLTDLKASQYSKDQHILKPNEWFNVALYIETGALRLYYLAPDGKESNKQFFLDNDIAFPIAPIALNSPSLFGIATCEDTQLKVIPFQRLQQYLTEQGCWQAIYNTYLEWLVNHKVLREHRLLTLSAEQKISCLQQEEPQVFRRIADYHLASYLGMSPVNFSRLKRKALTL